MPTEKANPTPNGNVPFQIPPLELSELFAGRRNGGITQNNNQYKAVTVICCDRLNIYVYTVAITGLIIDSN